MAETKKKGRVKRYLREVVSEIKKLEWPSKSKIWNNTIVVLAMMLFVTAFVWVLDLGFSKFLEFILGLAK